MKSRQSVLKRLVSNRSSVIPIQAIPLPTNNVFVGAVQLATLTLAVVLPTADLFDHDGPITRFFDGLDRFVLVNVYVLDSNILTVHK